jgi:hypothetical protein
LSGCGNFSRRKFFTTNITKLTMNFWSHVKPFSDAGRSAVANCARYSPKIFINTRQTEPEFSNVSGITKIARFGQKTCHDLGLTVFPGIMALPNGT